MLLTKLKSALKKYFHHLYYFYRYLGWQIGISILLSFSVGLLDGLGLSMVMPLISSTEPSGGVGSRKDVGVLGPFISFLNGLGVDLTLQNVLLIVVVLFALKGLMQFADMYYQSVLRSQFMTSVRSETVRSLSQQSYEHFVNSNAGEIQNTLSSEVNRTQFAMSQYFAALQATILLVVYILLAFTANPKFAALVVVGVGIMNIGYRSLYARTKGLSLNLTKKGHWYHSLLIQSVQLFKYLKATSLTQPFTDRLVAGIKEIEATQLRMGFLHAIVVGVREPMVVITIVTVIAIEVMVLGGTVSAVILSVLLFYRALASLMQMQTNYSTFLQASGALDSIRVFQENQSRGRERFGTRPYPGLRGHIQLNDVSFYYRPDRPVVSGVSLGIQKNETIAIVGESGSGKTTLVNLIVGLLKPAHGSLKIDGVELHDFQLDEYRRTIGCITQEAVIFSDTAFNNVTFWAPQTKENLSRFWNACRIAALESCIELLPERENTELGDNGVLLSGGQRQRVSIAREFYRNPEILILDEATSALDSETENEIQANIESLRGQCTMIVVAHRLSTIKSADRIIVMERGRIVGNNSFRELLEDSPAFGRMVELQQFDA